jgi:trans-2,3-dihydro-3-hydroxyanthranilate isomerase
MAQWDVFTSKRLEGNSLAVFFDGRGLSDAEMQAIAREMNLSDTTFILPRQKSVEHERGVRVRIFTVQEELSLPKTSIHLCRSRRYRLGSLSP